MPISVFRPAIIERLFLLTVLLLLSACNLPARRASTPAGAGEIYTAAAQTVQAQFTQPASPPAPPASQTPGAAPVTATPPAVPATASPALTASTTTPIPCERVKFIQDITIPDNTELAPGEVFVKTWRLQNAGSCSWTAGYSLVVEGQNVFNAPPVVALAAGTVLPGGTLDVSITLTAPDMAGAYRSDFLLANPTGQRFGLGDGSKPFWVQVKVIAPGGLTYDFISRAAQAEWVSGKGNNLDTPLIFGGADDDANGTAKIKEGVILENGATSGKVLLTFPKHVDNGVIAGTFPPYLVQAGDHLKVRLGFIASGPGWFCGSGRVKFQIGVKEGNLLTLLGEWVKTCDNRLYPVNIDLSDLKGRTVQVVFLVRAEGSFQDDWAIWNSPLIER
ncbi:MAG: hypothetical protein JXB15_00950 [Anaerolineales bacterium]|nr:hypothetical protein [Anaerolineales bacterium]